MFGALSRIHAVEVDFFNAKAQSRQGTKRNWKDECRSLINDVGTDPATVCFPLPLRIFASLRLCVEIPMASFRLRRHF
jgi:hypothetical protein